MLTPSSKVNAKQPFVDFPALCLSTNSSSGIGFEGCRHSTCDLNISADKSCQQEINPPNILPNIDSME